MYMQFLSSLLICFQASAPAPAPLVLLGGLDVKRIPEASGVVKSRRHQGIFWVHNDSGNPPLLFAIRDDGRIIREFRLTVPNIDWEDIAIDDEGHLYLGDIGNNNGRLPLRVIYRIDEPDPNSRADTPIAASAVTFYALSRENRFDAESLFCDRGEAYLVAKYLDGREAELFTVPLDRPSPLARPVTPQAIGRLRGFTEPATGADMSADRSLLAVCSTAVTRVYRRDEKTSPPWRPVAEVRYHALPIEGIAWDGSALILVAEGGGVYRIAEATWQAAEVRALGAPSLPEREGPEGRAGREKKNASSVRPLFVADRAQVVPMMTSTLPAAASPSATFRPPSLQTRAPASGRFSSSSPDEFSSNWHSLR